jgi:hypothetical protein
MKKRAEKQERRDDLRREYDLAKLKGGVRGKYTARCWAGTNLVLLSPDVAEYFPDEQSVNTALRALIRAAKGPANITSVTTDVMNPKKLGLILLTTLAVVFISCGMVSASYKWSVWGAVLAVLCCAVYRILKPIWRLRISTASGESWPLQSRNPQSISGLAQAIGNAIAHRA